MFGLMATQDSQGSIGMELGVGVVFARLMLIFVDEGFFVQLSVPWADIRARRCG